MAKRVQESLDIQTGIPLKRVKVSLILLPASLFHNVKVIKRFVYWRKAKVPQPLAAPAVACCPRRMRAVRSALWTARIKAVLQQLPLLFHLWFVLLLRPSKDFSSRLTSSLPLTHTHTHTSSVPSLPPSLLFSGERQLDGMIHLQESSLGHALLEFPGSRRYRVSNVVELLGGSGQEGGEALSSADVPPPDARVPRSRCPCSHCSQIGPRCALAETLRLPLEST